MKVVLTRPALADVDRAAAWCEERQVGIGRKFVDRVQEAVERIALAPLAYRKIEPK